MDVITCPFENDEPVHREDKTYEDGSVERNLVVCSLFEVSYVKVEKSIKLTQETDFTLVSVLGGEGALISKDGNEYEIRKGEHFILPNGFGEYELVGDMELIISGCTNG